jgi:phosphatidylinositol alpha-1,6-mannosyltransferase
LVLPNTVGQTFAPGDAGDLRRAWGIADKRILLTVGRMDTRERYKGHDLVIQALPHLVANGHDVHYVVLGDGHDTARLKALAIDTGVAERVHFKGAAGSNLLADAYRAADLFVMPSKGEGFGIAFLEAMACGTPALGLDVGGARDALADGKLGLTISQAQLSDAIMSCLIKPKLAGQSLAIAVRQRFGSKNFAVGVRYAWDRLLEAA